MGTGENSKVNVLDIAAYILCKQGAMTAMKLQKLVYYSQAWSLVWDDKPLFRERIEAWANGPGKGAKTGKCVLFTRLGNLRPGYSIPPPQNGTP